MSYKDFYNDFKNNSINDVLFFYGNENLLIKWAVDQVIDSCVGADQREFGVIELPGDSCTLDDIATHAMTVSMFGDKRIVLVRNFKPLYSGSDKGGDETAESGKAAGAKSARDALTDRIVELGEQCAGSSMVLFYLDDMYADKLTSAGKKLAAVRNTGYKFDKLTPPELRGFIRKRVNGAGAFASDRVIDHIIDVSGYNNRDSEYSLAQLENDIHKLVNAADRGNITAELVDDILLGDDEKYVFDLISALEKNDRRKALTLTENILRGGVGESMKLIGFITKQFELMYDTLELELQGMSVKSMAKATKSSEGRISNAYRAARRLGMDRIKKLLIELYNIDKGIKTGDIDGNTAIELFVLKA